MAQQCPNCHSWETTKAGESRLKAGVYPRYYCKKCKKGFRGLGRLHRV